MLLIFYFYFILRTGRPVMCVFGWMQFGNEISILNGIGIAMASLGTLLYAQVINAHGYVCMCVFACARVRICVCMHTYICLCVCMYVTWRRGGCFIQVVYEHSTMHFGSRIVIGETHIHMHKHTDTYAVKI